MKLGLLIAASVLLLFPVIIYAQEIIITGPDRSALVENRVYTIAWDSREVDNVVVVAQGSRTPVGEELRGEFLIPMSDIVSANQGEMLCVLPWIDATKFHIVIIGYDSEGNEIASAAREYGFRPAVLANRTHDGLYLDLSKRVDQRLYVQKGGKITHAYLSSSSAAYDWRARNSHTKAPHDHAGVYKVLDKKPNHYSSLFRVNMPWAMRYHGGHFIHATSPNQYFALGGPASSGCNRLTWTDAKELYHMTPVGTRVEVIGPNG